MTIVAQNAAIDPELAEKVDASGWAYHFRKRAEEAEQAAEHWYDEYQRLLHTNETTAYLLSHNRRMRALYYRIARRVEAELMQGVNDLADRCQQAEDDLETAYNEIERLQTILENECKQARQLQSDNRDLGDTVPNEAKALLEQLEGGNNDND